MSKRRFLAWPRVRALFWLVAVVLILALVLGGGARAGRLSDSVVQLASLPLLAAAFFRYRSEAPSQALRGELLFLIAIVLVPALQLIPLPPSLWTALPGREPIVTSYQAAGLPLPWMPLSLSPDSTWFSILSLLPAIAIFFGVLLLDYRERRSLSIILVVFGLVSVVLGLAQLMQGPSSPLRYFAGANSAEAIGFFANRNLYVALLYALMPLTAACAVGLAMEREPDGYRRVDDDGRRIVAVGGCLVVFAALVLGVGVARSRAGIALAFVATLASLALAWPYRKNHRNLSAPRLLFVAAAVGGLGLGQYGLFRLLQRFEDGIVDDLRFDIATTTLNAVKAYWPFGSGMGTFVPIYQMFEQPELALSSYINRAHNDFLELLLEAGAAAAVVFLLFIAWFAFRSLRIWRRSPHRTAVEAFDLSVARAGTVIVATLLLHSVVDFPLRTTALMAVIAFACAVMVDPVPATSIPVKRRDARDRRRQQQDESLLDFGPPGPQESQWRIGENRSFGARRY